MHKQLISLNLTIYSKTNFCITFILYSIIPLVNPDGYEYVRQSYITSNYTTIDTLENFLKNRNLYNNKCIST